MQSKHSHPQASRYPLFRFHQVREALQLVAGYRKIAALLNNQADQLPPFLLRLVLAYEFWEAGLMKIESKNWFSQLDFPFPFNLFSDDSLWTLATWFEITGAIALLLGLGTRFFAAALMMLTLVAIHTVHWPVDWHTLAELSRGFTITDDGYGNFKLPVIYLIMFLPLLFSGAGKWSLDFAADRYIRKDN